MKAKKPKQEDKSGCRNSKSSSGILIWPYLFNNSEIQKHYQNEPKFNDVCSRNSLP